MPSNSRTNNPVENQAENQAKNPAKNPAGGQLYKRILRTPGPILGWLIIWALGLAAAFVPWTGPVIAISGAVSLAALTYRLPSQAALVRTAIGFFLFWTNFSVFSTLFDLAPWRQPAQLAAWLGLGLHLALVWTPLELGCGFRSLTAPILGERNAFMLAIALVVLLKVLLALRVDLNHICRAQAQKTPTLPLRLRLVLIGRALIRLSLSRTYDLTRALMSR
ncbi:MAG: hypothetical protein LBT62_03565 [Deltaproteobacteria bacterium]|nr:hypothetical protein [Deltaproteobacteria bacterium]